MQYLAMRQQFLALLNRTDCTDALAKVFFSQAQQRLNRDLRIPGMEEIMVINTSLGDVSTEPLPADYLETIAILVTDPNGYQRELQFLDLGNFARQSNQTLPECTYYTRMGASWNFTAAIPMGSTAQVVYYGELTPLVNDTDEPLLALVAPDVIIYHALSYAADYFIDDRAQGWEAKAVMLKTLVQEQATDGDTRTGTDAVQPAYDLDDGVYY